MDHPCYLYSMEWLRRPAKLIKQISRVVRVPATIFSSGKQQPVYQSN